MSSRLRDSIWGSHGLEADGANVDDGCGGRDEGIEEGDIRRLAWPPCSSSYTAVAGTCDSMRLAFN